MIYLLQTLTILISVLPFVAYHLTLSLHLGRRTHLVLQGKSQITMVKYTHLDFTWFIILHHENSYLLPRLTVDTLQEQVKCSRMFCIHRVKYILYVHRKFGSQLGFQVPLKMARDFFFYPENLTRPPHEPPK